MSNGFKAAKLGLALTISGCVGLPELPSEEFVPLDRVVDHVQCELQEAVRAVSQTQPQFAKEWNAGFNLTIKVVENAKVAPSLTWVVPLDPGETFRPGFGATLDKRASHKNRLAFRISSLEALLHDYVCPEIVRTGDPLLNGLGILSMLQRSLGAVGPEDALIFDTPTSIGQTIDFDVTAGASFTPGLALIRLVGLGSASTSRQTQNSLDIAFALIPTREPAKPTEVIIVGDRRETDPTMRGVTTPRSVAPTFVPPATESIDDVLRSLERGDDD